MNYYEVLGVPTHAGEKTIRTAFRNLVRRYHPDAGAGASTERFREVVEAYETLSQPARRRSYDLSRANVWPTARVPVEPIVGGPVEPITAPEPMRRRPRGEPFIEPIYQNPFRSAAWIDELFDDLVHTFDDEFFGSSFSRW
jgi:curved DNA-binding protein CbpA